MLRLEADLVRKAEQLLPRMRAWRRIIHQYPELGFQEKKTSALVAKVLKHAGWDVTTRVAGTGVVGLLEGVRPGPTFAIRADMDALPIQEQNTCTYVSRVSKVMHACGHDGNTAMVLGAAYLLASYRKQLAGNIKLIFQPCEEMPPGGAKAMIRAGVLESPRVEAIIAGHVDTSLPVGVIGVKAGPMMAAADAFTLTIQGRGGHGAMPHKSIDAIAIAGQVITNLQHIINRELDPLEPAVLSIGKIEGGHSYNSIADQVHLQGTIRTMYDHQRKDLPRRLQRLVSGIARAHRAQVRFKLEPGHPVLMNDRGLTEHVSRAACSILGKTKVKELKHPLMSGEDFTYYARAVPACFFRVGAGDAKKRFNYPWHHPCFDFDERGLSTGTTVLAKTALDYLKV